MSSEASTLELRRELVFQIIETSRLLHVYVDHKARENGTTRAQWAVLGRLRRQEGLSQVELAKQLELAPISLVPLLDRLVDQGFVERRADEKDRRAKRLFLTAAGRRKIEGLDPLGHAMRAEILEGQSEERMQAMRDMLLEVKEQLKALTRSAHEHVNEAAASDDVAKLSERQPLRKRSR
jgi:DNA-binding MarR family transcriptional regulator